MDMTLFAGKPFDMFWLKEHNNIFYVFYYRFDSALGRGHPQLQHCCYSTGYYF